MCVRYSLRTDRCTTCSSRETNLKSQKRGAGRGTGPASFSVYPKRGPAGAGLGAGQGRRSDIPQTMDLYHLRLELSSLEGHTKVEFLALGTSLVKPDSEIHTLVMLR